MTQYKNKVDQQRKLIRLEEWRKGIKMLLHERKSKDKPWKTQIIYKDDSELIEWSNTNHKQRIASPHTTEDLIDMMQVEEHEQQRKLFDKKRRENELQNN